MDDAKRKLQGTIPLEIRKKPKRSLGYGVTFAARRIQPVTGREWVYTATDEQMEVLYDIEWLFGGFVCDKYNIVFREIHGQPGDDGFDGWSILVRNRETGVTSTRSYAGFPESVSAVLSAVDRQFRAIREAEASAEGAGAAAREGGARC